MRLHSRLIEKLQMKQLAIITVVLLPRMPKKNCREGKELPVSMTARSSSMISVFTVPVRRSACAAGAATLLANTWFQLCSDISNNRFHVVFKIESKLDHLLNVEFRYFLGSTGCDCCNINECEDQGW
jgi:hypothetical protein